MNPLDELWNINRSFYFDLSNLKFCVWALFSWVGYPAEMGTFRWPSLFLRILHLGSLCTGFLAFLTHHIAYFTASNVGGPFGYTKQVVYDSPTPSTLYRYEL